MATTGLDIIKNRKHNLHNVGNLNTPSPWVRDIANGTFASEDMDNWILVETFIEDNVATGRKERYCKPLTDKKNKAYLLYTPEDRVLAIDTFGNFYNGKGDKTRNVHFTDGIRFECSNWTKDATITGEIEIGARAHFDVATKKFIVHDGTHADYADSRYKFEVVNFEEDPQKLIQELALVRFELQL